MVELCRIAQLHTRVETHTHIPMSNNGWEAVEMQNKTIPIGIIERDITDERWVGSIQNASKLKLQQHRLQS